MGEFINGFNFNSNPNTNTFTQVYSNVNGNSNNYNINEETINNNNVNIQEENERRIKELKNIKYSQLKRDYYSEYIKKKRLEKTKRTESEYIFYLAHAPYV